MTLQTDRRRRRTQHCSISATVKITKQKLLRIQFHEGQVAEAGADYGEICGANGFESGVMDGVGESQNNKGRK